MIENQMEQIVQDHEKRISQLEKSYDEVKKEMTTIHTSQLRIENTLLQESREQKQLLNKLIDQKFSLDKINTTNRWKVIGSIVGGSGLFYLIIELIKEALK